MQWQGLEAAHADYAGNRWSQRSWNRDVLGIRILRRAIERILVDLRLKSALHLRHRSGKTNPAFSAGHLLHGEAVGGKPGAHCFHIRIGNTELRRVLLGSEPLVKICRLRIVQAIDVLRDSSLRC